MKKIGMCALLLSLVLLCITAAGCNFSASTSSGTTASADTSSAGVVLKPTVVAQITAVRRNKLTLALYEKLESLPESAVSSEAVSSENTSSIGASSNEASSAMTSSVYLTMDLFDLTEYQLSEETMIYDLGDEPCVLIQGEHGWQAGTTEDLIVGDSIVIIDDAIAGEGVWRIHAIERPASSEATSAAK